jgi:nitrite reductase/ring-hydroxylating ferredoxin subunit
MTTTEDAPSSTDAVPISPIALSANRYPTGWFQVAWSDELAAGESKLLHYFGEDFVIWRGESGGVHALDPYCLHLGANLGVGGKVEGEDIRCPWHRWKWDGDGRNVDIPYSKQQCKKHLRIRTWPIVERYGGIYVWHDQAERAPLWEMPVIDRFEDPGFYPMDAEMRQTHRVKCHPQLVVENGVDPAHVMPIHGAGEMPEIQSYGSDGHIWRTVITASYGAGRKSTWMTPGGRRTATLEWVLWGIGMGTSEWPEELMSLVMFLCATPVDDTYSDIRLCLTAKRHPDSPEPPSAVRKMIAHQMHTVTQDFFIWENMKVLHPPNFAPEEAKPYATMRKWAQQFYPGIGSEQASS